LVSSEKNPLLKAVGWNLLSTFFCGICGVLLLLIIGGWYGPIIFGVFNQIYALYIIFSQLGAFGIHLSLIKSLAENDSVEERRQIVFSSGMFASFLLASFFALILHFLAMPIGAFLKSPQVGFGLIFASIGIFFFSMNKSLLFSLNGLSLLKEYALYQAMRYVLMLMALLLLIFFKIDGRYVFIIFPLAEAFLFVLLLFFFRHEFRCSRLLFQELLEWTRKHLSFGIKSFGGHILLDLNTRVDVLCLGFFVSDSVVGIYSMAAIIAEASLQLPLVFRTVYTPTVVKFLAGKKLEELASLVRKVRGRLWGLMLIVFVLGYFFVGILLPLVTGKAEYGDALPVFSFLMLGIIVASGYVPFGLMIANGGYPGTQSLMMFLVVIINVVGNLILIPLCGSLGAAVATSFANISSVFLLRFFSERCFSMKI